jgi:hypothetical protein
MTMITNSSSVPDEKSDSLLIAVIENSVWGSLDMVKHAKTKFGSLHNIVQRFVNDSIRFLEAHENEIESFLEKRGAQVSEKLSNIVSKVREMYGQLVDSGIILDSTMFLNHLVLSGEDQVLAKEIAQNVREVRGGSSRVDLQACKLGTGRRFTTS